MNNIDFFNKTLSKDVSSYYDPILHSDDKTHVLCFVCVLHVLNLLEPDFCNFLQGTK
jgi:hypothetical protein